MSWQAKKICKGCGTELPLNHQGPCPNCGQVSKQITITLDEKISLQEELSIKHEFERIERDLKWLTVAVVLTVAPALVDCIIPAANPFPFIVSIISGIVSIYLGDRASRRIRTVKIQHFRQS